MKKGNLAAIIIVLALLVGGTVYALARKPKTDTSAPNTTQNTKTSNNSTDNTASSTDKSDTPAGSQNSSDSSSDASTVTFDGNSFSPSTLTVKSGDTVTFKNTSSRTVEFSSDPHPSHTNNPELNLPSLSGGDTTTFVVKKTGTWGYHDHLNSSKTGTIIVQ